MQLAHEDTLRLNVLLTQELQAVRIDESAMAVHALTPRGEARLRLSPTCRDDQYLRLVRELLSGHVLGSPGGYPVYLRRWTRMGQTRNERLDRLLLLGEPEAVVAVVHAPGLTDELARRAWWAMPTADNARRMLERACVVTGTMGSELARFLLEFLPFEEEPLAIMDSVRLVLQPGLIEAEAREVLWRRGQRKNTYYAGFLQAVPDDLPGQAEPHPAWEETRERLQELSAAGNPLARQLCRALSGAGQLFLQTAQTVLNAPSNQDVVVAALEAIAAYFTDVTDAPPHPQDDAAVQAVLEAVPQRRAEVAAMHALAQVGEPLVAPIFARTDAIGTVMRRKIEPVIAPVIAALGVLRGRAAPP